MLAIVVVQAGIATAVLGALLVLRPLAWLGVHGRRGALIVLVTGLATFLVGEVLPSPLRRGGSGTELDRFFPEYRFCEVHTTRVHASPARVDAALRAVTARDIRLFRTLMAIRALGHYRGPQDAPDRPILSSATSPGGGFLWLADQPGTELVAGTVGQFWGLRGGSRPPVTTPNQFLAFADPGWAKAGLSFRIEDEGGGWTRLTTETRVDATDPKARRRFAAYWRIIYPGSSLIRYMWLAAVKERAEAE